MESSSPLSRYGSLTPADRLRVYRKCFHDLGEQLVQVQEHGLPPDDTELQLLQAEMRCLEELIMVFTDLTSVVASKLVTETGFVPPTPSVDGLNMSLVTDILMLSATSPWTVFVAERSQWQICYVSPSVKRMFGWKPSDLLGVPAWDGCHADDVSTFQRMLLLKESWTNGSSFVYRRIRKDKTYLSVQATGRAVGVGWFAWVEQEVPGTRPHESSFDTPALSPAILKTNGKAKQIDGDGVTSKRSRKLSTTQRPNVDPELNPKSWSGGRPSSPLATPVVQARTPKAPEVNESEADVQETEDAKGLKVVTVSSSTGHSGSENDKAKKGKASQDELVPLKPKAQAPGTSSPSSSSPGPSIEEFDLLWGKKILLVEDDRVNRTIAQRLLESLKCNVTVACNGKEALDILQSASPVKVEELTDLKEIPPQFDLVLMDLLMPVMDGTKAVQFFRDWEAELEPPRKRMVIFALTSNVSDGDMVKCAISGFDEFVSKPLTIDKLLDRLAAKR